MLKVKCPVYYTAYPTFCLETEVIDHRHQAINRGRVIHSTVDKDYECFVEDTSEPGVFHIGAKQLKDDWDHKAGYVWSSRCSVMNQLFGTRLVEVNINSCAYAMDVDMLVELIERDLEEKFELQEVCDHGGEVSYRFKKI